MDSPPAPSSPLATPLPSGRRWHLRLAIVRALLGVFPGGFNRTRLLALNACGIRTGRATLFLGMPKLTGGGAIASRLHIGIFCGFNEGCEFDLDAPITFGDHISVGHGVRFLTTQGREGTARAAPITVGSGVWFGARCTVLGGVNIGPGSVIGAGTTVAADVPANSLLIGERLIPLPKVHDPGHSEDRLFGERLKNAWKLEFSNLRWRLPPATLVDRLLPRRRATRLRASLVRALGLTIGAGTRFFGMPTIQSLTDSPLRPRLRIGAHCTIGVDVILEFGEDVTIGDRVSVADGAAILTTTHELGPTRHRTGRPIRIPVVIGNDVFIGAGAIVMPGTTVGDSARVLPNSVVNSSVAPGVTVSGIPARPLLPV